MTRSKMFVLAIVLAPFGTASAENPMVASSVQWLESYGPSIEDELCLKTPLEAVPMIHTLGGLWRFRDGAIAFEVAPMMARALVCRPEMMLGWFEKYPTEFEPWIAKLPSLVFATEREDEVESLRSLQALMLESLEKIDSKRCSEFCHSSARRLRSVIHGVTVRVID